MGMLYREDILDAGRHHEPPTTWDEFAAAAASYRSKNPNESTCRTSPRTRPARSIGLLWQAGVKPFAYDGKQTVTIDVDSDEAKKVVEYWGDLVKADVVSTDPDFNDAWYQGLAQRQVRHAGSTAAWGPVFLQGTAAKTPRASGGPRRCRSGTPASRSPATGAARPTRCCKRPRTRSRPPSSRSSSTPTRSRRCMFATKQFLFPAQNDDARPTRRSSTRSRSSTAARR